MQITLFQINSDRTELDLTIEDAADVTELYLFTDDTFKDYSKAIDLASLLTGNATENISITLEDINENYFDGLYFIEAADSDEISGALTVDTTRYEECILNKLVALGICDSCIKEKSIPLINAQTALFGLRSAVEEGFIEEAFNIIDLLNKYCSNECKTCGSYKNVIDNDYYKYPSN